MEYFCTFTRVKLKKQYFYFYWSNILLYVSVLLLKYLICVLWPPLFTITHRLNITDPRGTHKHAGTTSQHSGPFSTRRYGHSGLSFSSERGWPEGLWVTEHSRAGVSSVIQWWSECVLPYNRTGCMSHYTQHQHTLHRINSPALWWRKTTGTLEWEL